MWRCLMARDAAPVAAVLSSGEPAADFTLPTADGGQAALVDFRGRWAVLVFLRYLG